MTKPPRNNSRPRAAQSVKQTVKANAAKTRTRYPWRIPLIGASVLAVIVAWGVMRGHDRGHDRVDSSSNQESPTVSPSTPEAAGKHVARRVVVHKPIEVDPRYDALLLAGDALRADVERFVAGLIQELSPEDAVHIRMLHRLHTPGHFVLALNEWAANPSHRAALPDAQQAELAVLLDRWSDLRSQIMTLSHQPGRGPSTPRKDLP